MFRIMPDAASRVAAFEKGELDMLYSGALPYTEANRLGQLPNVQLRFSQVGAATFLGTINTRNAPFSDKRVRKALAHAIDRNFLRENVMAGFALSTIGPVPPSSPLANKSLADYAFDSAKANALLDEAGFARGADGVRFPFRLLYSANDIRSTKMADVIKENLSAVGIRTDLMPLERAALTQRGYVGGNFDMIIDSFLLGPDPDIGVERLYNSKNIHNLPFVNNSGYSNSEVDKLFDEQRSQVDFAKRKTIYDRIQTIIWDDVPVLPLMGYRGIAVMRTTSVTDAFDSFDSSKESFGSARPSMSSTTNPAKGSGPIWWAAAALAVAGSAVWWMRSRRGRDDDEAAA
jgi:peptide/nickel transport system substrate-binding protein